MSVIKEYRNNKKHKITQTDLAKQLNVSLPTVKRWEAKTSIPSLIQAKAICDTLNLPFKKLLDDYTI